MIAPGDLKSLVTPIVSDAASLFDEIDRGTRNGAAILRPSYGPGERFAAETLTGWARRNGLEVTTDFALAGVPAAMIFVRNAGGSHNPAEDMQIEDFGAGVELLLWLLMRCD